MVVVPFKKLQAIRAVPAKVKALGRNDEKSRAVGEAMQLMLQAAINRQEAAQALLQGGFPEDRIEVLLDTMQKAFEEA